jgi:mono/diheme cytochrome c family protein
VRFLAGAVLILSSAACSKQEPPPAVVAAPVPTLPAAVAATPPVPPAPAEPATPAASLPGPEGETIFKQSCATCHMADGSGVPFLQPSIKGSAWISAPDPQLLLSLILRGSAILGEAAKAYDNDMPPVDALSDAEIAAVATYVRQRFAAAPIVEPVTPAQVAIARARPGLPE